VCTGRTHTDEIEALGPALDAYLSEFDDCFGRVEPRAHLRTYGAGQLSGLPRKSVEPIALAAGVPPRTPQQFLFDANWQRGMMRDRLDPSTSLRSWWPATTPTRWPWG